MQHAVSVYDWIFKFSIFRISISLLGNNIQCRQEAGFSHCCMNEEDSSCQLSCILFSASHPLCTAVETTSKCSRWIGLFPCSAFIDFSQTQRQTERKGLFRKKLNGQVAGGGWLSPLYWRGGKMSLLWRPLQQIASWLDECPQVRVEHVPPAAKREQIKGQRNPLEPEVRFLSTRPLCRQHFSGYEAKCLEFGPSSDLWWTPSLWSLF